MNRFPLFSALLIALALTLTTSCKKNNDGIAPMGGCQASWKVDGQKYSEDDMALCVYLDNTLNLGASVTGGDFQLQIDPITSEGVYEADPTNPDLNVIVLIKLEDGTQLGSANAQVTVTELSNAKAKGTFSGDFFDIMDFNQSPDYKVTDGEFQANF